MKGNIKISIVLPSRGRPKRLYKLLESIVSTTNELAGIEVVVILDRDDEQNYLRRTFGELNCKFIIGEPRRSMGELNQDCVLKSNGETIFFSNDDVVFRTNDWDTLLLREISAWPNSVYLMYPNDMFKGRKLCTFPIMSRKLLKEYPEILPRKYLGAFMDLHIMDIFKAYQFGARIKYLNTLVCEHQHYRTNAEFFDATYKDRDRFGDDECFIALASERAEIVSRLNGEDFDRPVSPKACSILHLLRSSASFYWRIKLFAYMLSRRVYRLLFAV